MGQARQLDATCRTCGKQWAASYDRCPNDGGELIPEGARDTDRVPAELAPLDDLSTPTDVVPPYSGSVTDLGNVLTGTATTEVFKPSELISGTQVGEYVADKKIGAGAMGTVYTAHHPAIGKRVAIKIMSPRLSQDPESVERFIGEARTVAAIRHPGIVDVFGFGSLADGRLYLVMELLSGESLCDRIHRGRIEFGEALDLLDQIARALAAAHDHKIIHRDLKPENVFLECVAREPRPIVKILDFGLAKLIDREDGQLRRTHSGQLLGTPLYMSPEQCRSKQVDHRTDIYALGCIAYELFCGRVPFDVDNAAEMIAAHLGEQPPHPHELWPEIPPSLGKLIFAMLAKDSAARPTLDEVRKTLAAQDPVSRPNHWSNSGARPAGATRTTLGASTGELRIARPSSARTQWIGALGVLVAAGAIVMMLTTRDRGAADDAPVAAPVVTTVIPPERTPPMPVRTMAPPTTTPGPAPRSDDVRPVPKPHSERTLSRFAGKALDKPLDPSVSSSSRSIDKPKPAIGTMVLISKPACDIYIDGQPTGMHTPQTNLPFDAGHHTIMLVNPAMAIKDTFTVEIAAGQTVRELRDYSRLVDPHHDDNTTTLNPFKHDGTSSP